MTRTSVELSILGSGSSGNASVLRTPGGVLMIDAGIGPRAILKRLQNTGVTVADVRALVLTHLDSDHFSCNWVNTLAANGVRVYVHFSRAKQLLYKAQECSGFDAFQRLVVPFDGDFEPLPGVNVSPISLAHDEHGSHGYVITSDGVRIGFATDLGRVPPYLIERFTGVDILAIESNYDPQMQRLSGRPMFLQHRITGGRGHLSNSQALAAVKAIFARCDATLTPLPAHVVLLHRSRDCNCPVLLRDYFASDARIAPRLTLAEPFSPTPWLAPAARVPAVGEQMTLAF
ncbi:MAG TPA: MBL fold metallo-hydrolase [Tepidisphaeraceae bacterium]|jgi:phosphoribosyl 1,2-cyclic phosphodiesterase|nr:MBL fold metallo-hydrolase [Tepidisphaeraceae bacterium]